MELQISKHDIVLTYHEQGGVPIASIKVCLPHKVERIGHIDLHSGEVVPAPGYSAIAIRIILAAGGIEIGDVLRRMSPPG